jgi:hypothetical protein
MNSKKQNDNKIYVICDVTGITGLEALASGFAGLTESIPYSNFFKRNKFRTPTSRG